MSRRRLELSACSCCGYVVFYALKTLQKETYCYEKFKLQMTLEKCSTRLLLNHGQDQWKYMFDVKL